MNKREIGEIRRLFTKDRNCLTRLAGCYVDHEKQKVVTFKTAFSALPEEEMYKYLDIFRKSLSGTIGKNLNNMEFPLEEELEHGAQKSLMMLRDSALKEDALLDVFYDKIIETWGYGENYLILVAHGAYDIPMKTSDDLTMDDASEFVYNFVLCCLCPVDLSKAGLCYNAEHNMIEDRIRDWIVDMPAQGFLFPAFNERNTDIHGLLYYSKDTKEFSLEITEQLLGCQRPLPAPAQKASFQEVIEQTLGEECVYDVVLNIHENLHEMIEENKDNPDPVELDREDVRHLLAISGVTDEQMEEFEQHYDENIGAREKVMAQNVTERNKFEIKNSEMTLKLSPEQAKVVETKIVDGVPCLVIPITDDLEVNGVAVRSRYGETEQD